MQPTSTSHPVFSSKDLARAVGLSRPTVATYLRRTGFKHHYEAWYRLDAEQFERAKAELLELKALCPSQPLRALTWKTRHHRRAGDLRIQLEMQVQTSNVASQTRSIFSRA